MITDYTLSRELDAYIKQRRYPLVNAVLAEKDGTILLERYYNRFLPESRNHLKSVWKSILAITAGICIDKGIIGGLDDPIASYLPAFARRTHPYHALITVRHLLTMSSGLYWNGGVHYHCPMMTQLLYSDDWIEYLADVAMAERPGMHFVYKEWDVMLLSALIGSAAGRSSYEICKEYLYTPLQINSGIWAQSPCGVSYTVLEGVESQSDLCARDMAKIGWLFLQAGRWEGETIVSEAFVREAVTPSAAHAGYGFLWWLFDDHYSGRGFGGQAINVYPNHAGGIIIVLQAKATPSSKGYDDVSEWLLARLAANAIN